MRPGLGPRQVTSSLGQLSSEEGHLELKATFLQGSKAVWAGRASIWPAYRHRHGRVGAIHAPFTSHAFIPPGY